MLQPLTSATDPCVHCGFCLPTCASYRVLGNEMDSPRGRIHTLKAIDRGELELDATVASHFDTCLGCFACVSACPSGVRYDQLIEATRPKLNAPELRTPGETAFRKLLFALLPYPRRLRAALSPLRRYAGSRLQELIRQSGLSRRFGNQIKAMEELLPALSESSFRDDWPVINRATGEKRGRVGLVLGCVQRVFDPEVNAATVRVLTANGFEVVIPTQQGCCGAATHHQGETALTETFASELINSFRQVIGPGKEAGSEPLDAVLVAASGCGHTMKQYGSILSHQTHGQTFANSVFDVHEFLDQQGLSDAFKQQLQPLRSDQTTTITYHDACHMLHGQQIKSAPRSLLQSIPNVKLKEAMEAGVCCGSAGIYNLVRPDEANALGAIKAQDLATTNPDWIASANIGCTLQIRKHLKDQRGAIPVAHPMQLLDQSFRNQPMDHVKEIE